MAGKLRVQYGGAINHVLNRGERREPIFQTDRGPALFPGTPAETRRKTGWQGDAQKLIPARRLSQETTMTWQWTANRFRHDVDSSSAKMLRGPQRAIMCGDAGLTIHGNVVPRPFGVVASR
jgi:hypothetical protein